MEFRKERKGDTVKVEIRDFTRKLLYRDKFQIGNQQSEQSLLFALKKFGFSAGELKGSDWW